ncbi:N-acetylmuramoyl-L-alanine amidase [Luteolibacter sp. LG18]|uniref:N-acetylmuramoyl-L-alanine amidase n=1 Tax=Luteolibacter sp. LG18 TaxID=2819286 RepID=UPI002B292AAB|nr:N-acetylmuramoyl-L-alanine amidase [Luteolibacter sp. LG18]
MTEKDREKLYTVRWFVREKWNDAAAKAEVLALLAAVLEPEEKPAPSPERAVPVPEEEVPGRGAKALWCPFAKTDFPAARTRGRYERGYPVGAIVHFTAGRRSGLKAGMEEQVRNGHTYFVIDAEGNIGQNFPLDSWGSHAGESRWKGLNERVSNEVVGIEIQAAGKLERKGAGYETYFHVAVPPGGVRVVPCRTENQEAGAYEKFTEAQERALFRLLRWLQGNHPEVFRYEYVLGHDEVSPGRKNDPGGALSMTMPELRRRLLEKH